MEFQSLSGLTLGLNLFIKLFTVPAGLPVSIPFRADTGFEPSAAGIGHNKPAQFQSLSGLTLGLNRENR